MKKKYITPYHRNAGLALLVLALGTGSAMAASGTWTTTTGGTQQYDTATNWSGSVIADGAGSTGTFQVSPGSNQGINLATSRTLGNMTVASTNNKSQTFTNSATKTLTLDNSGSASQITRTTASNNSYLNLTFLLNNSLNVSNNDTGGRILYFNNSGVGSIANNTSNNLTITNNGTGNGSLNSNSGVSFNGVISDGSLGGSISMVQNSGNSPMFLVAANTYSGKTTNQDGTLTLSIATALQNSTIDTTNSVAGGIAAGFKINTGVTTLTVGGLSGNKNIATTGGVFTTTSGGYNQITALTLNPGTGKSETYSGNIENGAANMTLTKSGLGTQILSGTNSYTGQTTVANGGGILRIDAATALGSGALSLAKSGATTGTLQVNVAGTNTFNNSFANFVSSNGLFSNGTANIQNLQGDNTFTGNMSISNGGGNGVNIQSDAGSLTISGTLSNLVTASNRNFDFGGAGIGRFSGQTLDGGVDALTTIIKNGTGIWSVTGTTSSSTGGAVINAGTLNVAKLDNTGSNSSLGSGGNITLAGGILQFNGSGAQTSNRAFQINPAGGTIDSSASSSSDTVTLSGTFTSFDPAATNVSYTNGSTAANVTNPDNRFAVGMVLTATGLPVGTTINAMNAGALTLSQAFTGITGNVSTTQSAAGRTLILTGSNTGDNTVSSVLANSAAGRALSVAKTGSGVWVLSGTSTYTGETTISSGTLKLGAGGSLDNGTSVSIAAGATFDLTAKTTSASTYTWNAASLSASGTASAATISSDATGTIAMGATPITLTTNGTNPSLTVTGAALSLGGNQFTVVVPGTALGVGVYTLVSAASITGTVNATALYTGGNGLAGGTSGVVSISGNTVILTVTPGATYASWALAQIPVVTGPPSADSDNDGVSNGVEYFMNAPAGFTANPALNGANTITWANGGNIPPSAYGTQYVVQTSGDLVTWADVLSGSLTANSAGPAGSLTYILTGTAPRFVRLKVTPN